MYIKRTESQRKEIDSDSLFFTDNACNSLTLDAVANAIKNTVFHVKNFTSQDKRGSKGGSHNLDTAFK
jgi:hypothetical protein